MRTTFTLLLLLMGSAWSVVVAADPEELSGASDVWDEVVKHRERLNSGVYHIKGTYTKGVTEKPEIGESDELEVGNISCFGAFDFSAGKIRFDRTFPSWTFGRRLEHEMGTKGQGRNPVPAMVTLISGAEPNYSFHYLSASKSIELHQPEVRTPPNRGVGGSWVDVRGLGIYHGDQMFLGMTLEEIIERRRDYSEIDVRLHKSGLYELSCLHRDVTKYEFFIDPERGYTVTKFMAKMGGPELGREDYDIPYLERHVKWEEVGGTWVPVAYRCTAFRAMETEGSSNEPDIADRHTYHLVRHDWKIEWESVNQPIPDVIFNYDVLPLEAETKVVDRRLDQPFLLKVVGRPDYPLRPIPQVTPGNERRSPQPEKP